MAIIRTNKGEEILVDSDPKLLEFLMNNFNSWWVTGHGYPSTDVWDINTKRHKRTYLHRIIYTFYKGDIIDKRVIDHINRNKLDNRIQNLRMVIPAKNSQNRYTLPFKENPHKGVRKTYKNHYQAYFNFQGKQHTIGTYKTEQEAAFAYNLAAKKYYGENCYLNDVNFRDLVPLESNPAGESGYKGIRKTNSGWVVRVKRKGIEKHIGSYKTLEDAIQARESYVKTIS